MTEIEKLKWNIVLLKEELRRFKDRDRIRLKNHNNIVLARIEHRKIPASNSRKRP